MVLMVSILPLYKNMMVCRKVKNSLFGFIMVKVDAGAIR
jgi:hypothetical protein